MYAKITIRFDAIDEESNLTQFDYITYRQLPADTPLRAMHSLSDFVLVTVKSDMEDYNEELLPIEYAEKSDRDIIVVSRRNGIVSSYYNPAEQVDADSSDSDSESDSDSDHPPVLPNSLLFDRIDADVSIRVAFDYHFDCSVCLNGTVCGCGCDPNHDGW
jgi:hypothetical protein